MKNKKGFTLVELLAVIVILALIMSIAIVSISGVLQDSREKAFRETAVSIIKGVRQRLVLANEQKDGFYYFDAAILESGGKQSPFGDDLNYGNDGGTAVGTNTGIYYKAGTLTTTGNSASCKASVKSFVHVGTNATTNRKEYYICLTSKTSSGSTGKYVMGSEDDVMTAAQSSTVIKG